MERRRSTAIVLAASFLCLIFGLGCTVIGIFGEGWWIENLNGGGQIEDGVLRYCKKLENEKQECGYYPNLFSFTRYEKEGRKGEHRDVVLLCLCAGCGCSVLALIPFVIAACMMVKTWGCVTLLNSLCVSLGAVLCMTGMVYAEVKFNDVWKSLNSDRTNSWSYMLAWIGAGFLFISAILSFISVFLKPREMYKIENLSSPTGARSRWLPRSPLSKAKANVARSPLSKGKYSPGKSLRSRENNNPPKSSPSKETRSPLKSPSYIVDNSPPKSSPPKVNNNPAEIPILKENLDPSTRSSPSKINNNPTKSPPSKEKNSPEKSLPFQRQNPAKSPITKSKANLAFEKGGSANLRSSPEKAPLSKEEADPAKNWMSKSKSNPAFEKDDSTNLRGSPLPKTNRQLTTSPSSKSNSNSVIEKNNPSTKKPITSPSSKSNSNSVIEKNNQSTKKLTTSPSSKSKKHVQRRNFRAIPESSL